MDTAFQRTLTMLAAAMGEARDPWWIIGSAAIALHGAGPAPAEDVDVLLSVADARRILPEIGVALTPGIADARFRSELYCQWTAPPLTVDFMAGFTVRGAAMIPATREAVTAGDATLFVPSRRELEAILRDFARPKDIARADALAAISSPEDP